MTKKIYHVLKNQNGWYAEKEESGKVVYKGSVKRDVVAKTFELAQKEKESMVVVHKGNGVIHQEKSFPENSEPRKYKAG
jgi:hypothetical protein